MSLISLVNITKQYQIGTAVSTVVKGVSFTVNQGDLLAIVGASGSGKSTIMNIIGLLDKADSGDYFLKNRNIAGLSPDELALLRNQYIGFVFQQFNLLPRFSAFQNVGLPLTYRGTPQTVIKQKVNEALSKVGMLAFAAHCPTQLSGGQQQRIAIARALVTEPEVILADEPTGALDSKTSQDIMDLFLKLHQDGRTIILITHDEKIANWCSRRITLADGEITGDGQKSNVSLVESMTGSQ